ncbi:MAG: trypsin-like peptidase domain-containing protein [Alphaproteobacteria bacterium]|nr:trypsin-like peptidase domain-containing protein [Alphaproteobacteria bacterium]
MSRPTLALLAVLLLPVVAHAVPADDVRRTPVVEAVERATPAVVTVKVEVRVDSPFRFFREERRASEGSGVIIDGRGLVLTNAHVVDGATRVEVHLQDERAFAADVLAQDGELDLAVLQLRGASDLPVIALGDSSDLLLGETVIAIGNPLGLGLTVSTGVLSSTGRDVPVGQGPVQTYLQTDAAINPGNSGGALVDLHGRLVGINTFIHASAEGVGFAIPVNRATKIAADLLAYGEVQVPWLGATFADVGRGRLGGAWAAGALLVERVEPGGPAARAGLRPGDLVGQLDGHRILTRADLNARLAERRPGVTVRLQVLRGDRSEELAVVAAQVGAGIGAVRLAQGVGVQVQPVQGGLQVTQATREGSWVAAGLRVGDVILGVDGVRTASVAALTEALDRAMARHRGRAWFTVARGPYQGTKELPL